MVVQHSDINLVEASINDLKTALHANAITAVDLVSRYLARIAAYDTRGPTLNSICVLNSNVFAEAQASDDWRASGRPPRALEGIPYTVKDSYKVKGMVAAAGSPAFADLIATEDCFVVEKLREAGAVLIGRTNMPPMADGGCQRGVYGRAESPYHAEYLTAAFASGSSNGSGTSTAASFAAFGMGGETVSSGRSPASNNALIGYSPSRGIISCRGVWPLYPTCDVLVPHTRSMQDLFQVMNVLAVDDTQSTGDFWRQQPFVAIPSASCLRPRCYSILTNGDSLQGKRIGVPKCYIGVDDGPGKAAHISPPVLRLWKRARDDLLKLGAEVVETDFPLVSNYESQSSRGKSCHVPGMPPGWNDCERNGMIALAWNDFLKDNADLHVPALLVVDPHRIHPKVAPMDDQSKYTEPQNIVRYEEILDHARKQSGHPWTLPGCAVALRALEDARKQDLDTWMAEQSLDLVAFPTAGDIAPADSELQAESRNFALREGIKYSNGGRALKHLGVPAVTVPMGEIPETGMPVGLTFLSRAYEDTQIMEYACAFEQYTQRRQPPKRTPRLPLDTIQYTGTIQTQRSIAAPYLTVRKSRISKTDSSDRHSKLRVELMGVVGCDEAKGSILGVDVQIHGHCVGNVQLTGNDWTWTGDVDPSPPMDPFSTERAVPRDHVMVIVLARASNGRCTGQLLLLK